MGKYKNSKFQIPNSNKGQSLLEVVIAVALAGVLLGGAVALIVAFTGSDKRSRELQTAIDLANDIIENVRNLTSGNWQYVYALNHQLSAGLVANWKFDVDASDATGNAPGTLENGAIISPGKVGNALSADGINQYVFLGDPAQLRLTSSMTVAAWAKLSEITAGEDYFLINKDGYDGKRGWGLWACGLCSSKDWLFVIHKTGFAISGASLESATGLTTDWTHIVATYDALATTPNTNIYINGMNNNGSRGGVSVPNSLNNPLASTTIGARSVDGPLSSYFPGLIDELRVYNRPLSPYEARALYLGYETPQPYYVSSSILSTPSVYAVPGEETIVVNGVTYTRWFHVKNVYRNLSGNIVDSGTVGAFEDPSTQQFIIRIIWGGSQTGLYLSQYLTRSRNEIFQQSDWSGGPGQPDFPNENANNKFATSSVDLSGISFVDYSSSQGSLSLKAGTPASGTLESSVFDTKSSDGVQLNSILWQGTLGAGPAQVEFQIARSSNPAGPWNYIGPNSSQSLTYAANLNDVPVALTPNDFNHTSYFRYKIFLGASGAPATDGDGVITSNTLGNTATAIAKDSTYMYVGGYDDNWDWRIEKRLLSTGALVPGFGTLGVITGAAVSNVIKDIEIDSMYMYLVGTDSNLDWRIEKRLLLTGALDASFGTGGVITVTAGFNDVGVAIDSTYMYVVGKNDSLDWQIEKRFLSTGAPENSFGVLGIIYPLPASFSATAITIDSTHMYVAGKSFSNWRIEKRLLSTGAPDAGFAAFGVYTSAVLTDFALDIEKDANYMYVVGYDVNSDWHMEKLSLTTGALDAGFGAGGIVTGAGSSNIATGIASSSPYMYVVGNDSTPDWRIERHFLSSGLLAPAGFGAGGIVTGAPATVAASDVVIDLSYMYVVGTDGSDWRIEKRSLIDGLLEPSFGNDIAGLSTPIVDDVIINYSP